jgi:hypothetical protein
MSTGAVILLVIVIVLALAAGAWLVAQQTRRKRLRQRFGPEYDRRITESGDRRATERELTAREKRHARFDLRPLTDTERTRYAEQWTVLQEQFVDQPGEAIAAAEQLVHMVMRERGYPAGSFDQQAEDLSVEHGPVVGHYRDGHDIHLRHQQGGVSTEELRRALMHYRAMFVSLTGIRDDSATPRTTRAAADPDVDHAYRAGRADAEGEGMPATPTERPVADQPRRTSS